jgi:hypothetical protein
VDAEALGLETELDLLDLELLAALFPGLGAVLFALLVTDIFIVVAGSNGRNRNARYPK